MNEWSVYLQSFFAYFFSRRFFNWLNGIANRNASETVSCVNFSTLSIPHATQSLVHHQEHIRLVRPLNDQIVYNYFCEKQSLAPVALFFQYIFLKHAKITRRRHRVVAIIFSLVDSHTCTTQFLSNSYGLKIQSRTSEMFLSPILRSLLISCSQEFPTT